MAYILNTEQNIKEMLKVIGVSSLDELYSFLPEEIKLRQPLSMPSGQSEYEFKKTCERMAAVNNPLKEGSFLGAGCYDHYIPQVIPYLLNNSPFLTAYTPYQAECSQGILQAIYEYQSYLAVLTGMDVACTSLLDGASSFAEAVLMAMRITKRNAVVVSETVHPEYVQVLKTYLSGSGYDIRVLPEGHDGFLDESALGRLLDGNAACLAVQSPNFFGLIEDLERVSEAAHSAGSLAVLSANPLSFALFRDPGSSGIDIVCGDAQVFGLSSGFGGCSCGFLAARQEYLRQFPGRIVGKTTDLSGNTAYCLTLQTREQHIKRERATSNICSNHSFYIFSSLIYLALMGSEGLVNVARRCMDNAHYLYSRLSRVRGVKLCFGPRFFNEFLWEVPDTVTVYRSLCQRGVIPGYLTGQVFRRYRQGLVSCCTEKKSREEIDNFVNALAQILHGQ